VPLAAKTQSLYQPRVFYSALKQTGRVARTHTSDCCQNSGRCVAPQEMKVEPERLRAVSPTSPAQPRGPFFPEKAETSALKEFQNIQPSSLSPTVARATRPKKGKRTGQVFNNFPVDPKKIPAGLQFKPQQATTSICVAAVMDPSPTNSTCCSLKPDAFSASIF